MSSSASSSCSASSFTPGATPRRTSSSLAAELVVTRRHSSSWSSSPVPPPRIAHCNSSGGIHIGHSTDHQPRDQSNGVSAGPPVHEPPSSVARSAAINYEIIVRPARSKESVIKPPKHKHPRRSNTSLKALLPKDDPIPKVLPSKKVDIDGEPFSSSNMSEPSVKASEKPKHALQARQAAGSPTPGRNLPPECRKKENQYTLPKTSFRTNYNFEEPIDPSATSAAAASMRTDRLLRVPTDIPNGAQTRRDNRIKDFFSRVMAKGSRKFYENFNNPSDFMYRNKNMSLAHFNVKHYVAQGAFGTVLLCQEKKTMKHWALKIMPRDKIVNRLKMRHLLRERDILRSAEFPFIVYLLYSFKDNACLYMVMRFCPGGDLFYLLRKNRKFSEPVAKFYASQVLLGLEYLHSALIIYRDLKPENLMLTENGYIRLTDLGFARIIKTGHRAWTFCGTAEYMPPEIISNTGHTFAADWWSYGILIYELTTGSTPFASSSKETIYKRITDGSYYIPGHISRELHSLVRHLLQSEPTRRYGNLRGKINDIRLHPWMRNLDWRAIYAQTIQAPFKPLVPAAMFESRPLEKKCLEFIPQANKELHPDYFQEF